MAVDDGLASLSSGDGASHSGAVVNARGSEIRNAYFGSNAMATRRSYGKLESIGPLGQITAELLRAQKASARAKKYHGGHGRVSYRRRAYERKSDALGMLCALLESDNCRLHWGWTWDPNQSQSPWVIYIDLPNGQVSFHARDRGHGPSYEGNWDGKHESEERIIAFAETLMLEG